MKVLVVPSSVNDAGVGDDQFLISYIINDTIAIDAGCLGFFRPALGQTPVRHVFISHTHIDHVASLPIFLENCYDGNPDCVTLHASKTVVDGLQKDMFNGRIWPDFIGMSSPSTPFMKVNLIESGESIEIDGVKITVISVDHLIPTVGYIIEDGTSTVIIPSDTGPTEEIWRIARHKQNVKGVFLEAAFPNSMSFLAKLSKHLTPAGFEIELEKMPRGTRFIAIHIKSRWRDEVIGELNALDHPHLEIGEFGKTYEF